MIGIDEKFIFGKKLGVPLIIFSKNWGSPIFLAEAAWGAAIYSPKNKLFFRQSAKIAKKGLSNRCGLFLDRVFF